MLVYVIVLFNDCFQTSSLYDCVTKINRDLAIGMLIAGKYIGFVYQHFNVHINPISRLQNSFKARGTTADLHRSGRPRVTTTR